MDVAAFRSNFLSALPGLIAGSLVTALGTKLYGKTKRLRFSTTMVRIALAANDDIFGSVRVSWREQDVRKLYLASVEVENASGTDFESVDL
jgi:hypothetical protein